ARLGRRRGAATLVSRGCSPGESGFTGLAAAVAPVRTGRANAGVHAVRRGGARARAGAIAEAPGGGTRAASGRAGHEVSSEFRESRQPACRTAGIEHTRRADRTSRPAPEFEPFVAAGAGARVAADSQIGAWRWARARRLA